MRLRLISMTSGRFRFFIDSNVILDYFYGENRAKEIIETAKSLVTFL